MRRPIGPRLATLWQLYRTVLKSYLLHPIVSYSSYLGHSSSSPVDLPASRLSPVDLLPGCRVVPALWRRRGLQITILCQFRPVSVFAPPPPP